jgi:hypothetical protein
VARDVTLGKLFHVIGSREKKGVRLYGRFDYYLIYNKKLVRICGDISRVSLSKSWVERP